MISGKDLNKVVDNVEISTISACQSNLVDGSDRDLIERSGYPEILHHQDRLGSRDSETTTKLKRQSSAPPRLNEGFSSAFTSSFTIRNDPMHPKAALKSPIMTRSLPNLSGVRSQYNRGMGFLVLATVAERGHPGRHESRERTEEFDKLLDGL